jgi:hypothetical protein
LTKEDSMDQMTRREISAVCRRAEEVGAAVRFTFARRGHGRGRQLRVVQAVVMTQKATYDHLRDIKRHRKGR